MGASVGPQDKLQSLAGKHADVLETLSPVVRKRVEVLRDIQVRFYLALVGFGCLLTWVSGWFSLGIKINHILLSV